MSRWSRRSTEEKARIKANLEKKYVPPREMATICSSSDKIAGKVYEAGEFPLLCLKHSWVGSDKYRARLEKSRFTGRDVIMVHGKCRLCGESIKRASPSSSSAECGLANMVLVNLKREGRLTYFE